MISFFNLYELFPAFICAINIESIVNNLLGVKFFNPVLVVFLFQGFNFTLSAIIFSGSSTSSSSYVAISGKLVEISGKSRFNISGSFRTFTFFFESSWRLLYWVVYTFKNLSYNLKAVLITTFPWASFFGLIS